MIYCHKCVHSNYIFPKKLLPRVMVLRRRPERPCCVSVDLRVELLDEMDFIDRLDVFDDIDLIDLFDDRLVILWLLLFCIISCPDASRLNLYPASLDRSASLKKNGSFSICSF